MTSTTENLLEAPEGKKQTPSSSPPSSSSSFSSQLFAKANMTNTKKGQEQAPGELAHQQDIIRLLAQHFNNQFYQIANNQQQQHQQQHLPNNDNPSQPHMLANNVGNVANFQSPLAPAAQYHHQQQQQQNRRQQQFSANQEAINFASPSRPIHNLVLSNPGNQSITNHLARSQPQPSPLGPGHGVANQAAATAAAAAAAVAQSGASSLPLNPHPSPLSCNPLLGGEASMNFFNALNCFNMTNDQFLLSLQQQYLLQAASTVRHFESRQPAFNANANQRIGNRTLEPHQNHIHQVQGRRVQGDTNKFAPGRNNNGAAAIGGGGGGSSSSAEASGETTIDGQCGKELLKFSINTILGRRSPAENNNAPSEVRAFNSTARNSSPSINQYLLDQERIMGVSKQTGGLYADGVPTERAGSSSPECDPDVNSDIESNSSVADTPKPSSLEQCGGLINLTDTSNHHQSASSSALNSSNHQRSPSGELSSAASLNQQQQQVGSGQHHATTLSFLTGSTSFPWTVAARGKPRRGMMRRAVFSDSQRVGLEKRFQLQKYISKPDRKKLAEKLGLRDSQVKIWFQNRRMKWRNSKERELLSAGGSREQTLPTRNNPNPDLSDVGETIKRLVSNPNSIGTV